jgi:hypothetical protein
MLGFGTSKLDVLTFEVCCSLCALQKFSPIGKALLWYMESGRTGWPGQVRGFVAAYARQLRRRGSPQMISPSFKGLHSVAARCVQVWHEAILINTAFPA